MTLAPSELEAVVRTVVERLVRESTLSANGALRGSATTPESSLAAGPSFAAGQGLTDRVVTLASLETLSGSPSSIVVRPDAILTPAARDVLAQRGIRVERGQPVAAGTVKQGPRLLVASGGDTPWRAGMLAHVERAIPAAALLSPATPVAAVRELAERLDAEHPLAVLLTDQAALALCLANRHQALRAIAPTSLDELQRASAQVGANLLVVDVPRLGVFAGGQLVRAFWQAGAQAAPAELAPPAKSKCGCGCKSTSQAGGGSSCE